MLLWLPKIFSKEITFAIHSFWWSNGRGAKGISWVRLKVNGGLGFRDLCLFNLALLAKQAWRFHSQPNALWVRILSGIYLKKVPFLHASHSSYASLSWKSLLHGRDIFYRHVKWRVGNGASINPWTCNWGPDGIDWIDFSTPNIS